MSDIQVRPCPWCGGDAKVENIGEGLPNIGNHYTIGCQDRKCLGSNNGRMWGTPDKAIEVWNGRPVEPSIEFCQGFSAGWDSTVFEPDAIDEAWSKALEDFR